MDISALRTEVARLQQSNAELVAALGKGGAKGQAGAKGAQHGQRNASRAATRERSPGIKTPPDCAAPSRPTEARPRGSDASRGTVVSPEPLLTAC